MWLTVKVAYCNSFSTPSLSTFSLIYYSSGIGCSIPFAFQYPSRFAWSQSFWRNYYSVGTENRVSSWGRSWNLAHLLQLVTRPALRSYYISNPILISTSLLTGTYVIEFYGNSACGALGFGEGEAFFASGMVFLFLQWCQAYYSWTLWLDTLVLANTTNVVHSNISTSLSNYYTTSTNNIELLSNFKFVTAIARLPSAHGNSTLFFRSPGLTSI